MQVNLEIASTTTNNKKQSTNIAYVNPNVPNATLKTFAQSLIGLTTNTFSGATRIAESDVDSGGGAKITPTLSIGAFSYDGYRYVADITYNGDGTLFGDTNDAAAYVQIHNNEGQQQVRVHSNSASFSGTIYATEGATYAAKSITFQNS